MSLGGDLLAALAHLEEVATGTSPAVVRAFCVVLVAAGQLEAAAKVSDLLMVRPMIPPPFPDDADHITQIAHHVVAGTDEYWRWSRGADGKLHVVQHFTVRVGDPLPVWTPDAQGPVKMPTIDQLVVPVDPDPLSKQQGGIETGKLQDGFQ